MSSSAGYLGNYPAHPMRSVLPPQAEEQTEVAPLELQDLLPQPRWLCLESAAPFTALFLVFISTGELATVWSQTSGEIGMGGTRL